MVDAKERTIGLGSGFFLSSSGSFLTAFHLFRQWEDARGVCVDLVDAGTLRVRRMIEISAASEKLDVVIGQVALEGAPVRVPPVGSAPRLGTRVTGIRWSPLGQAFCTAGEVIAVSAREVMVRGERFFTPGSSGGPVFGAMGSVVGVAMEIVGRDFSARPIGAALGIARLTPSVRVAEFLTMRRDSRGGGE